jgi:hypothetical protein
MWRPIVKATSVKAPIPIYLYHFPSQSGLPWHVKLIARLLDAHKDRMWASRFLRRYGLRAGAAGHFERLRRVSDDGSLPARSAKRHFRGLHLGDPPT